MIGNRSLFIFLLISSVGSWLFWLGLGPYVLESFNETHSLGVVAFLRQISLFLGVVVGTVTVNSKRDYEQSVIVEILTLIVLLVFYLSMKSSGFILFSFLGALRFFLSGVSVIYTYSAFSKGTNSLGNSVIAHLLSTQGAVIFSAIIGFAIFSNANEDLTFSVLIDMFSSLLLVLVVLSKIDRKVFTSMRIRVSPLLLLKEASQSFSESCRLIFQKKFYPWNCIYILCMILIGGLALISNIIGDRLLPKLQFQGFSKSIFVYGVALWVTGFYCLKRDVGWCELILSCLGMVVAGYCFIGEMYSVSFVVYMLAFGLSLNTINKIILNKAEGCEAGRVRGSLGFYLTTIFAGSEILIGRIIFPKYQYVGIGYYQLIIGIVVLGVIVLLSFREKEYKK